MENIVNEIAPKVKLFDSDHMEEPEGGDSLYDGTAEESEPAPASTPIKDLPESVKTRIKAATWFAKQGCGILRVHPGAKIPSERGWQNRLLTEGYAIQRMLSTRDSNGRYPNYGICPRDGMVIVDTDNGMKNGRQRTGEKNLAAIGDLPATVMTRTPSGGFHRFYRVPAAVTNSHSLPEDVDVRGIAGQVVGIGCELIEGLCKESDTPGTYERVTDSAKKIGKAPAWLVAKLTLYKDKSTTKGTDQRDIIAGNTEVGGDPAELSQVRDALSFIDFTMRDDQDGWAGLAKSLLFDQLPVFHEGERISLEVAEELCFDAMSGRLWGKRIGDPSFHFSSYQGRDELRERLGDGVQYTKGGKTLGTIFDLAKTGGWKGNTHANTIEQLRKMAPADPSDASAVANKTEEEEVVPDDGAVPGDEVDKPVEDSPEDHLFSIREFLGRGKRREFVIGGWLPTQGVVGLLANRKCGKSLIATDLTALIACGMDWQGLPISSEFDVAVYLCGEDDDGLELNLAAWEQDNQAEMKAAGIEEGHIPEENMVVSDKILQLLDPDEVDPWIESLQKRVGDRRAVTILDSWQRATSTTKGQNADDDMARCIENAERLAKALNGPLIILVHPPKRVKEEEDLTIMGSSIIENTVVALWTLWEETDGIYLRTKFMRGARAGSYRGFKIREVELAGEVSSLGTPYIGAVVDKFAGTETSAADKAALHEQTIKAWSIMVRTALTAHEYIPDGEAIKPTCKKVAAWIAKYADTSELVERSDIERGWYAEIWAAAEPAGITSLKMRSIERALSSAFFPNGREAHYNLEARNGVMERLTACRKGNTGYLKIGPNPLGTRPGNHENGE